MAENKKTISYEIDDDHDHAPSSGNTKYTITSADIDLLRVSGVSEDIVSIDEEIGTSGDRPLCEKSGHESSKSSFFF